MDLRNYIKPELWDAISDSYEAENFKHAILDAIHVISDLLREKSGVDGDGVALVGKALGGDPPLLRLNKLQTQSEKDEQKGMAELLRGIYQAIRNPRSHEQIKDSKQTADTIILFVNYMLDVLGSSEKPFTVEGFLERVTDPRFVHDSKYASLLVDEIPKNKQFDTLVTLYREKNSYRGVDAFGPFVLVINELIACILPDQRHQFLSIVSDELKTVKQDFIIRQNFQILLPEHWGQISEIARLRIENIVFNSIQEGQSANGELVESRGWLATWGRKFLGHFENVFSIQWELIEKLKSDDLLGQDYVIEFFLEFLYKNMTDSYDVKMLLEAIHQLVLDEHDEMRKKKLLLPVSNSPQKDEFIESLKAKIPGIEQYLPPDNMGDIPF